MNTRQTECPDRNLAMELVRVTEAAALASGRWVGRGMKNEGDGAAVDAMRKLINSVNMRGVVVIGEGEKDEAPMLFNGEEVGTGQGADVDIAVDPTAPHSWRKAAPTLFQSSQPQNAAPCMTHPQCST